MKWININEYLTLNNNKCPWWTGEKLTKKQTLRLRNKSSALFHMPSGPLCTLHRASALNPNYFYSFVMHQISFYPTIFIFFTKMGSYCLSGFRYCPFHLSFHLTTFFCQWCFLLHNLILLTYYSGAKYYHNKNTFVLERGKMNLTLRSNTKSIK